MSFYTEYIRGTYGHVLSIGVPFGATLAIKGLLYTQGNPQPGRATARPGARERTRGKRGREGSSERAGERPRSERDVSERGGERAGERARGAERVSDGASERASERRASERAGPRRQASVREEKKRQMAIDQQNGKRP